MLAGSPALNAGSNPAGLTTDQRGQPRTVGAAPDIGAYEYQPITVADVQVNDGSAQRSEVRSISVTFSGPVSFAGGNAAAAFALRHVQDATDVNNLEAVTSTNAAGQTVVTLTFTLTGNATIEVDPLSAQNGGSPSLADGRYQLTVFGAAVSDAALGWPLDGDGDGIPGGDFVSPTDTSPATPGQLKLYRLFGDINGDGFVNGVDLIAFRPTVGTAVGDPNFLPRWMRTTTGSSTELDLIQFRNRIGSSVFPTGPIVAPPPPTIAAIAVNDGAAQRSEVRSITVTFSGPGHVQRG